VKGGALPPREVIGAGLQVFGKSADFRARTGQELTARLYF
jgi:hypothetical protein